MADFSSPLSSFIKPVPGFNSNGQVTWVFLCPLKQQTFILWTFAAHLNPSFHPGADSYQKNWSFQPRSLHPSRALPPALLGTAAGTGLQAAKPRLNTRAHDGDIAEGADTSVLQVSFSVYETMLSPLPTFIGSLEDIPMEQWHRNSLYFSVH